MNKLLSYVVVDLYKRSRFLLMTDAHRRCTGRVI